MPTCISSLNDKFFFVLFQGNQFCRSARFRSLHKLLKSRFLQNLNDFSQNSEAYIVCHIKIWWNCKYAFNTIMIFKELSFSVSTVILWYDVPIICIEIDTIVIDFRRYYWQQDLQEGDSGCEVFVRPPPYLSLGPRC